MAHYYELILTSDNKEILETILSDTESWYLSHQLNTHRFRSGQSRLVSPVWRGVDDVKIITRCEHGINLDLDECEEDCKPTSRVAK
jgi:predicted DNA-binding protein